MDIADGATDDGGSGAERSVSVIVPVYNDPEGLWTTLDALTDQTYPDDQYEVLVVDNDSTDDTRSVAAEFATEHENVHVLVEDEVQSSYAARNRGIRNATGDLLAFVDADMWVDDDWLAAAATAVRDRDADYLACRVELVKEGTGLATEYSYRTEFQVARAVREWNFAPTCCLLVDRAVIEDVGPFDERLVSGGDNEFGNRVHDAGYELHYAPEVVMYHPARSSLESLVRKSLRMGRGKAQQRRFYPDRYRPLYDPRNVLPAHPVLFRSRLSEKEVGHGLFLALYLLKYALKLCKVSRWGVESLRFALRNLSSDRDGSNQTTNETHSE